MSTLSPAILDLARKNESAILQAMARTSQTRIAEQLGLNESQISRYKDGDLQRAAALMAACGLKVNPADAVLYERDIAHALTTLARDRLQGIAGPEELACR